jgi:hypothetical protein
LSSNVVKLAEYRRIRRRSVLTSTGAAILVLVVGMLLGAALSVLR